MEALDRFKWDVSHDPCRVGDRTPLGAVPIGTTVHLRLRVNHEVRSGIESAVLVVREGSDERTVPMAADGTGYSCTIGFAHDPHVAFYYFALMLDSGDEVVYAPRSDGRSTSGELYDPNDVPCGFQVSVYEPAFATPDWFAGAIMYQVFPDRFSRGQGGVRQEGIEYHERMGRPVHLREDWNEPIAWEDDQEYDPVDFYGGTLQGIKEKLPYLASLGVEALYLNPVCEARSNHRYDTADYEHIDPLLGTDGQFAELVQAAAEEGISIILDAVLSHTGSDSRYFNALGTYDAPGAAQGEESPYYDWYDFTPQESGAEYRCWWGDPTLPEVDERNESWQRYILGEILPKWLAAGARGVRLDVADELPDDVLERLRTAVKAANQEAVIIGEVWEDATTKESYGQARTYALGRELDSVMNYPLRDALLGFATGRSDAYQLSTFLKLQHFNYPAQMHRCLMNLLSSHDVERMRTYLACGGPIRHLTREEQYEAQHAIASDKDNEAANLQVMVTGLLYALPGSPCIYYGDERGMQGGSDPFCRAPMVWGDTGRSDAGEDLTDHYRALGSMRKKSNVLRNGGFACMAMSSDVICVVRTGSDGEAVIAVCNRSADDQRIVVDLAELGMDVSAIADGGLFTVDAPATSTTFWDIKHGIVSH